MKVFPTSGVLALAVLSLPLASSAFAEQSQPSQAGHVMETVQFPPAITAPQINPVVP